MGIMKESLEETQQHVENLLKSQDQDVLTKTQLQLMRWNLKQFLSLATLKSRIVNKCNKKQK